jgi:hypothetical protein
MKTIISLDHAQLTWRLIENTKPRQWIKDDQRSRKCITRLEFLDTVMPLFEFTQGEYCGLVARFGNNFAVTFCGGKWDGYWWFTRRPPAGQPSDNQSYNHDPEFLRRRFRGPGSGVGAWTDPGRVASSFGLAVNHAKRPYCLCLYGGFRFPASLEPLDFSDSRNLPLEAFAAPPTKIQKESCLAS